MNMKNNIKIYYVKKTTNFRKIQEGDREISHIYVSRFDGENAYIVEDYLGTPTEFKVKVKEVDKFFRTEEEAKAWKTPSWKKRSQNSSEKISKEINCSELEKLK